MFTYLVFWPWFAGLTFLTAGLFVVRRELAAARGLDKLIVLGPVFFAFPLAVFAAEHFLTPRFLVQMVPAWMPVRLFWVYFVGTALIAGAISLVTKRFVHLSATLLGVMFFLFVLMLYLPLLSVLPVATATGRPPTTWAIVTGWLESTGYPG